jgi:hypothetical protein
MNRKTMPLLSDLPEPARRRFLKRLGLALGAPAVPAALRYAINDMLCGEAYAQTAGSPTYFIEINLRDQQDLGQIFVPPSIAKYTDLQRGDCGNKVSLFFGQNDLKGLPNNVYLTPDSAELEPHVGSIAYIDLFELTAGSVHYHQSANRTRAPDCSLDVKKPGQIEMWNLDKPLYSFPTGTEKYHCAIPTPATFHNYYQKKIGWPKNGLAFKGISRQKHAIYHCAGALPNTAELDRMIDKNAVYKAYNGSVPGMTGGAPTYVPSGDEIELLARILGKVDPALLRRAGYGQKAIDDHLLLLGEAKNRLKPNVPVMPPPGGMPPTVTNITITPEDEMYWKTGVPEQDSKGMTIVPGLKTIQDGDTPRKVNFQGWEQYALAWKLIASGQARSVAIECEFIDWHDTRPEGNMKAYTWCTARPLARLINKLKGAGLYKDTLIAIYTTDGSRAPSANSSGDQGKNTVILAGGMLEGKGGYYGDIGIDSTDNGGGSCGPGHNFIYKLPDLATGAPTGGTFKGGAKEPRVPGGSIWKTVMRLLRVPDSEFAQWPEVANAKTLDFLLKG